MTKREIRTKKLMEMLRLNNRLDVATVAESLEVSEATVRRLFSRFEDEGRAIRVFGGIQLAPPFAHDYSYRVAAAYREREKAAIGNRAMEFVERDDRIFMDSGTTVLKMAEALCLKLQEGSLHNIVVVTNSLFLIDTLAKYCRVILIGGEIRVERRDVCGPVAEKSLSMFHVNKAFLGADAVSRQRGFMATDERTAKMNELIVERADRVFVLADSEKFRTTSFMTFAPLSAASRIFTDSGIEEKVYSECVKSGVNIDRVEVREPAGTERNG
jgi:DeoR/GlpR family transcriptional regulator of sugar metabolism